MKWMEIRQSITFVPRRLTARLRVLPDFLIIGVHKCGTTSLYDYLKQHPLVIQAFKKEIPFFGRFYLKGENWYRAHFPTIFEKKMRPGSMTGEAYPGTIFDSRSPQRIQRLLPHAKMIVLMRNPVDRAFSHYQHNLRENKGEMLSFEEAIKEEAVRWAVEMAQRQEGERRIVKEYKVFSYLTRGHYAEHLEPWLEIFPRDQFHFIKTEEMSINSEAVLRGVFNFLSLSDFHLADYKRSNEGRYGQKMNPETRKKLLDYYRPHNEKLARLLGRDFGWYE